MKSLKQEDSLKESSIYEYHKFTKHTVKKLTSSGHFLDWANQPEPFLTYTDATRIELSRKISDPATGYGELVKKFLVGLQDNNQGDLVDLRLEESDEFISNLLFFGTAISAWKQVKGTDNKWALRVNASSGNLHPTETSVIIGDTDLFSSLNPGLYHYSVLDHALEKRIEGDILPEIWKQLGYSIAPPPVLLCVSSIFWREAWKYRDRAFRYCHLDLGHALASLTLSASLSGWQSFILSLFVDQDMVNLLGMADSPEKPVAFIALEPSLIKTMKPLFNENSLERTYYQSTFKPDIQGTPIELSENEIKYSSIEKAYKATIYDKELFEKTVSKKTFNPAVDIEPGAMKSCGREILLERNLDRIIFRHELKKACPAIRTRRSAVDMDGKSGMELEELEALIVFSSSGYRADYQRPVSFDGGTIDPSGACNLVDFYFYIHRVEGLKIGLYYFDRLRFALVPLAYHDQKEVAMVTSCFQEIASDGAFSISMIANFNKAVQLYGERGYTLAHNEAGFNGQMLYLAVNSLGFDATGIGCFIDDMINEYLVLNPGFEVIYNFTVGRAVVDSRLTTLPSYPFCKTII